jgi:hypothetical protein
VGLHGVLGDDELGGDLGVGQALGHAQQHVHLAHGELGGRGAGAGEGARVGEVAGAQEAPGAEAHRPGRALVLGDRRGALGQGAVGEGVERVGWLSDDEHRRLGRAAADLPDGLHPRAAVVRADEHDVGGAVALESADQVGDGVHARQGVEDRGEVRDQTVPRGRRCGEHQAQTHTPSSPR